MFTCKASLLRADAQMERTDHRWGGPEIRPHLEQTPPRAQRPARLANQTLQVLQSERLCASTAHEASPAPTKDAEGVILLTGEAHRWYQHVLFLLAEGGDKTGPDAATTHTLAPLPLGLCTAPSPSSSPLSSTGSPPGHRRAEGFEEPQTGARPGPPHPLPRWGLSSDSSRGLIPYLKRD